ncbi:MAG: glycosyltransferase family 1 protein [Patescibacteria group bacterium]
MKRIGIECESIEQDTYGIARIILKTLEEISRRPELAKTHRFYLYFKSRIPDYPFLDNPIFIKEVVWQPLPYRSFVLYYYVFLPIRLWFARLNAMYFPNYMLPIIFLGKSLVLLTDDIYYEMRSPDQRPHHRLAYWVFGNWAARFATKIMAISETSKRELVRLFKINPDRITVNHLGVDTPKVITKPYTLTPNPHILFVGQAFPRRHLRETLLAFEKLAAEFPNLDFIFVGSDKYSPPIIDGLINEINNRLGSSRAAHRKNVSDKELSSLYKHAKAVTYISSREAFGLPPLEALAHGSIPVVADNTLSHELFGDNAFMVPELITIESIYNTLRDTLTDTDRREKILNSAPSVVSQFTWKSHADRLLDALKTF